MQSDISALVIFVPLRHADVQTIFGYYLYSSWSLVHWERAPAIHQQIFQKHQVKKSA